MSIDWVLGDLLQGACRACDLPTTSGSVWLVEHGGEIAQWAHRGSEPLTLFYST